MAAEQVDRSPDAVQDLRHFVCGELGEDAEGGELVEPLLSGIGALPREAPLFRLRLCARPQAPGAWWTISPTHCGTCSGRSR